MKNCNSFSSDFVSIKTIHKKSQQLFLQLTETVLNPQKLYVDTNHIDGLPNFAFNWTALLNSKLPVMAFLGAVKIVF